MNYDYDFEYQEPEPTVADEILAQATQALILMDAAKDKVKTWLKETRQQNERLTKENKKLRGQVAEAKSKVRGLAQKETELKNKAKRMTVKEFFGQRSVFMYKPDYASHKRLEKCDKCDEARYIHYKTPLGNAAKERCSCFKWLYCWEPKEMTLESLRKRRGEELFMWFRTHHDDDGGFSGGTLIQNEWVFDKVNTAEFSGVNKNQAYFSDKNACQLYCDWLNENLSN